MRFAFAFVLCSVLAMWVTAVRAGPARRADYQIPKIISAVAACLHKPPPSPSGAAATMRTITLAIAAIDTASAKQSRRFYNLIDRLVAQVNTGGIPPGYLWSRFLRRATVSNINGMPQRTRSRHPGPSVPFSLYDYRNMLVWMEPYLARKDTRQPATEAASGTALIALEMEDPFAACYAPAAVAHYSRSRLTSPAMSAYVRRHPVAWVIAHNAKLHRILGRYYLGFIKMDYFPTVPMRKAFQSLLVRKGKLSKPVLHRLLAAITKLGRLAGDEQFLNQWQVCHWTWQLLNLARERKDAAAAAIIKRYIHLWISSEKRPYVRRWLLEALGESGPPPKVMWQPPIHLRVVPR